MNIEEQMADVEQRIAQMLPEIKEALMRNALAALESGNLPDVFTGYNSYLVGAAFLRVCQVNPYEPSSDNMKKMYKKAARLMP